jgi:hypothetical protein
MLQIGNKKFSCKINILYIALLDLFASNSIKKTFTAAKVLRPSLQANAMSVTDVAEQ